MNFAIKRNVSGTRIFICDENNISWPELELSKEEQIFAQSQLKNGQQILTYFRPEGLIYVVAVKAKSNAYQTAENIRKLGAKMHQLLQQTAISEVILLNRTTWSFAAYNLAEGICLAAYQFLKYRSDAQKKAHSLKEVNFDKQSISVQEMARLKAVCEAAYLVRDLVNEPLQFLTAEQLSKEIVRAGKTAGFRVQVLGQAKIEQLGMGGILAVNKGSLLPPTFTILEHRSTNALNKAPIVLVGKGIVYDTGGLSLKPTAGSMDRMKSDMSGAALIIGALYVAAQLDLPLNIIGLVPATENRPGAHAYTPGDIITMYNGSSVEVLNTDAEGRLVLADALHYARKYRPELVLDFATLTGSAANTIGDLGIVCMGTASDQIKEKLKDSGNKQFERLVELPLWEEYGEQIKSEIADLKNIGGPQGGAITAAKFLEHFTDYPWMHFDIAGVSFAPSAKDYRPAGGTAFGMRMLVDFLCNYSK